MNRKTEETGAGTRGAGPAAHARHWLGPPRLPSALSVLLLIVGCMASVVLTSVIGVQAASAGTAPAPPAGWSTVFSDNFAGPAGSAPSSANWFYDIGTGYGTGEIENTTNSTSNVYLDGNGDLVLKAIDNGGTWTSGRIESTRDDFQAPAGGELEMTASIEQPNPASGLGYWPAFWALGSPMRAGGGWPQSGEIDMMEDVNGLNEASQTLHDSANSPGHALMACPTTGCQTGYNTYSVIINRVNTSAEYLEFLMDGTVESTITEASVGTTAWQDAIDHGFYIIFDLAMGGNYPNGECDCTTPTSATTSGASMSVQYVAVYEEGGNSTPTGTATATGPVTGDGGLCLANKSALNTEGNPIIADSCDGDAGQQWSPYTDGTLRTQGGCLDVVAAGTTSGTDIDWYACNGTNAQDWTHESNGELVNPNSGLCLTDPGGNPSAQLELEACTDSAAQVWNLPSGGGTTTNTVTVSNPDSQTSTVGTAASLQVGATDSASGQTLTYSASGLPAGLSINSSTGLISGTPTTAGTSNVTVTATDTTGADGTASFTWTVNSGSTGTGSGGVDISAGGPAAAPFVADEDYSGGATADTTNAISTTGVTNPAPQSVYQHNRYGNFTYTIPGLTAGASYTVTLDFAEEYWTAAGDRLFNVLINGNQVLTNFDIFATAGGEYIAVDEPFTATASSTGTIAIQFVTVKDNAQVNGIQIQPT
jgi:Malectin domain/Ricin-type beta-trefoil lectin domain/Putative Ig domain